MTSIMGAIRTGPAQDDRCAGRGGVDRSVHADGRRDDPRSRRVDGRSACHADHGRCEGSAHRRARHRGRSAPRHSRLYHDGRPDHPVVRLPTGKTSMSTDTRLNLTPQFVIGVCSDSLRRRCSRSTAWSSSTPARTLRFWPVVLIALGGWIVVERGADGSQLPRLRDDRHRLPAAAELVRHRARPVLGAVLAARHRAGRRAPDHADARTAGASPLRASSVTRPARSRPGLDRRATARSACSRCSGQRQRASNDKPFRGGEVTSILGGTQLDLRQATIEPGHEAVINIFVMMGGHEVWVPQGWTVVIEVDADSRRRRRQAPAAGARHRSRARRLGARRASCCAASSCWVGS